jgi:hypothetical protein
MVARKVRGMLVLRTLAFKYLRSQTVIFNVFHLDFLITVLENIFLFTLWRCTILVSTERTTIEGAFVLFYFFK